MPPSEPHLPACPRCSTRLPDDAAEGSLCELCEKLVAQENLATVEVEVPESWQTAPPTVAAAPQKEVIGDYEILGKLGQGGMGAVYRARQISLDRVVALKILPSNLEEDENFVARFQREAAVAAGLNHPNLVHVYASGVADGVHFIAMELVEGENLRQRLKREPVPMLDALRICLEVARGLQFAWQRAQLIHRDIKPSNIYLAEDTVKVGDLGLAKSLLSQTSAGLTHTGVAIGTPHYISPEQARGDKSIDLRADIYSLGCTLYELLTGATPYKGTDPLSVMSMHLNSPPPAIMKVMPQCPMPIGRLVNKMLRKARHERHQTYEELIAAMEQALAQLEHGPANTGPSALVSAWKEIGAAEQQGGVARGPAPTPVAKSPTATALAPARKSKTGLMLGIAASVLLVGLGAYKLSQPKPVAGAPQTGVRATSPTPSEAGPAKPVPKAEEWHDVLADLRRDTTIAHQAGLVDDGASIRAQERVLLVIPEKLLGRDGAVRIVCRLPVDAKASMGIRAVYDADGSVRGSYRVELHEKIGLSFFGNLTRARSLGDWAYPQGFDREADHTFEFRVVGDLLTVRVDERELAAVHDRTLETGGGGQIVLFAGVELRSLQSLNLDGAPAAGAPSPAAATKDAPFTNSLGMKFVPVPITGGPTGGQRVLFSIWETRSFDYEAFAKETQRAWPKPPFEQTGQHPAVNVNWDDATAFCQWLTDRERNGGRIGATERYRLPSDHEWSCAVGIGEQEDAASTPEEKNAKVPDTFPWGSAWPPPAGAGNFSGEETRGLPSAKGQSVLAGYRDGFTATAPVGSFSANRFGLFDLEGNAREWCEDWFDARHERRVGRGSSFDHGDRVNLLASCRSADLPTPRYPFYGFRVVLAPGQP